MARKLTDAEAKAVLDDEAPAPKTKYPWAQWTDGSWWEIKRGEDFERTTESMRSGLAIRAKRHSMKVTTHKRGDTLLFKFSEDNQEEGTT